MDVPYFETPDSDDPDQTSILIGDDRSRSRLGEGPGSESQIKRNLLTDLFESGSFSFQNLSSSTISSSSTESTDILSAPMYLIRDTGPPNPPCLYIDSLVKRMALKPEQAADLCQFAQWGAGLDPGDLFAKLSTISNVYCISNKMDNLLARQDTLEKHLKDFRQSLNDKWQLKRKQKSAILIVAKDLIFNTKYTDYGNLASKVRDALMKRNEFADILSDPLRMKILNKEIGQKCRNVKNQFRKAIRDTTLGDHKLSLNDAVSELGEKFLMGDISRISCKSKIQIAFLRRFARENPHALNMESDDDGDSRDVFTIVSPMRKECINESTGMESSSRTIRRGKIGKNHNWWSQIDDWFSKKCKEWSDSLDSPVCERDSNEILRYKERLRSGSSSFPTSTVSFSVTSTDHESSMPRTLQDQSELTEQNGSEHDLEKMHNVIIDVMYMVNQRDHAQPGPSSGPSLTNIFPSVNGTQTLSLGSAASEDEEEGSGLQTAIDTQNHFYRAGDRRTSNDDPQRVIAQDELSPHTFSDAVPSPPGNLSSLSPAQITQTTSSPYSFTPNFIVAFDRQLRDITDSVWMGDRERDIDSRPAQHHLEANSDGAAHETQGFVTITTVSSPFSGADLDYAIPIQRS